MAVPLFDKSQTSLNQGALDDPRMFSGPEWDAWRVFLAVAKAKSLNRASQELGVSDATVGRSISRLETALGSPLIRKTRKGIELTEVGCTIANRLITQAHRFQQIVEEVRGAGDAKGQIRITATEALAGLGIVPAIPSLTAKYPKISLHIQSPINLLSFRENKTDIMVGFGPCMEAGVESRRVGNLHLVPVAARSYVQKYGAPRRDALSQHHFLDCSYYSSATPLYRPWRGIVELGSISHTVDSPFVYALLAKMGAGIALLGTYTLADRDAVHVDVGVHIKLPIFIYADSESLDVRAMRVVYNWLAEIFSADNPWFGEDLNLTAHPEAIRDTFFSGVTAGTPLANSHEP